MGTNNSVPPVCMMHRSRVRRATQGDQKAQGQNRTHHFFSSRPRCACLGKAQAAPSQQIAASRLVTSAASLSTSSWRGHPTTIRETLGYQAAVKAYTPRAVTARKRAALIAKKKAPSGG